MRLTATVKILPTLEQRQQLLHTLERANAACQYISEQAWLHKAFGRVPLHHLTYYNIREQFGLTAQVAVRCIGKVADAYKLDKKVQRMFQAHGAVPYDSRVLKWYAEYVSIWTLDGRAKIPFVCGDHQRALLTYQQGESDLVYRNGEFYLFTTCAVPDETPLDPEGFLGVDLGIANIATDSDGERRSGKHVNSVRHRNQRLRQKLQKKGTKSAKRLLKKRSGRESRFVKDVNHCISKALVMKAQRTERGIALEDLTDIRERVWLRKPQRTQLHNWSFHDLGNKIAYKAQMRGIVVKYVDPRNTSRECSQCGHVSKSNRPNQATFQCTSCGNSLHADVNAAINIGRRASVNAPNADSELGSNPT